MLTFDFSSMILQPIAGGILIGVAVTIMLLWNGRVTGISGILNGLLSFKPGDMFWRVAFASGLIVGGLILRGIFPTAFVDESGRSLAQVAVAGLIVGFGTIMGSGCTSGHGICGISRFSIRSILATIAFMGAGFLSAFWISRFLTGAP